MVSGDAPPLDATTSILAYYPKGHKVQELWLLPGFSYLRTGALQRSWFGITCSI